LGSQFDPDEAAEERRLWADCYEALARALEIMQREATSGGALERIESENAIASRAITRIKEIRGLS
jgi:plasmid stabilization system protein ParE